MLARYVPSVLLPIMLACPDPRPDGRLAAAVFASVVVKSSISQLAAVPGTSDESPPQSFSLNQLGEHVFHFRKIHGGMTLFLKIEGSAGESDRPGLTHFQTVIEASLFDDAQRTICRAVGSPGESVSADSWVLTTGGGQAAFWHRNCAEIKLKRSEQYTLTVRIRAVDPKAPKIKVTPRLERSDAFGP